MSTTVEMPIEAIANEYQQFVLTDVSWESYEAMLAALGDRAGLRLTYDRGVMEFMTKSQAHELWISLLRRRIELMCFDLKTPYRAGGSFTFRREIVKRGLEPDECYWIQHEQITRGKGELDFSVDPPPDLAIEVEVSRSSLDRHGIYAALGVPELWAFDGKELRVYHRREDGAYEIAESSLAFPFLTIEEVPKFLRLDDPRDEQSRLQEFIEWARSQKGQQAD